MQDNKDNNNVNDIDNKNADNSTDTDYDNDKNKILSLSEGIYLHPVSILDDRELSTNCIHVTQDNMDILYDTLPENIFFICY